MEVKNLSKAFEDNNVLNKISFNVDKGSIFGLIGPNGAGKSTLIRTLTGIYRSNLGEVKINGEDVYENSNIKKVVGYVADENNFFASFKVKEVIKYYSIAYETFDIKRFDELNEIFKISEKQYVSKLSKGMKTRLAIMLNLSIRPQLLIMDEPTSGLDPIIKRKFMDILMEEVAERGTTIIISSHNLGELERVCDSVAIMNKGEITYMNSIENMKKSIRKLQVVFNEAINEEELNFRGVQNITKVGRVFNLITNNYTKELLDEINQMKPVFIEEIDLGLEDMFIYALGEEV